MSKKRKKMCKATNLNIGPLNFWQHWHVCLISFLLCETNLENECRVRQDSWVGRLIDNIKLCFVFLCTFRQHCGRAGEFHGPDPESDGLRADQALAHADLAGLPAQPQIHRRRKAPGWVRTRTHKESIWKHVATTRTLSTLLRLSSFRQN